MTNLRRIMTLISAVFLAGSLFGGETGKVDDHETTIVIGGEPTSGWAVLPASESEYRFKLKLTGDVVTMRWADLDEAERRRVQKIYGIQTVDGRRVFGDKVRGVRYRLTSGKTVEGLPLVERGQPGRKAIRTAAIPLMLISESDIQSSEMYEAYESDFYSPGDVYQKWLLEKPPGNSATAHLAMAQRVANIGLFSKAIDHLTMAAAIDPKMEEANKDLREQFVKEHARQRVQELYTRMVTAKNGRDFGTAFTIYEQLERSFPDSEFKSRWEALRPELLIGVKTDLGKRVVEMSYTMLADLLQKKNATKLRVDEKNNIVPSLPGKQVTTRHGHVLKGKLDAMDNNGDMVLWAGNTHLTIKAKEIVAVKDIDLSLEKIEGITEIDIPFQALKDYINDKSVFGLKMQMIAAISKALKQPESIVLEIFDQRLKSEGIYDENGNLTKSPVFATSHEASYGAGSWLREGSKPALRQQEAVALGVPAAPVNEDPSWTDDGEIWWKAQNFDTRINMLRAIAAEKVFTVTNVVKDPCPNCGATGTITVIKNFNQEMDRCPLCRGIGVLFRVQYH